MYNRKYLKKWKESPETVKLVGKQKWFSAEMDLKQSGGL